MKNGILIYLTVIVLGVSFFVMTLNNVFTETYDIERFSLASETIRSPITIENEQETERKTRETVQGVADRYKISDEVSQEQLSYIREIFDAISILEKKSNEQEKENSNVVVPITNQMKIEQLKQILSENITSNISDSTFLALINVHPEDRTTGSEIFLNAVEETLGNGVRTENIQTAISNVNEAIKYNTTINESLKEPLMDLTKFAIVENSFFDVEKTSEARKEAASSVEPVMIRAGEVIVREGQTITNEIYEKLNLVGLLDKERNVFPIVGLVLLIVVLCGMIVYEMKLLDKQRDLDKSKIISIISIPFINISLMKIVSLFMTEENHLFLIVPAATSALLTKLLINDRVAFVLSAINAIFGSIIFNGEIAGSLNTEAGIYFFISQLAAIYLLVNVKDRTAILKTGFGITVVNLLIVLIFIFLSFEKYSLLDLVLHSSLAIASALLSAVLTIGLLPFFETGLGILSDIKLLQLSNPTQPLLKKILTEAPGTYHHSVMVANLSETACEAIGANGLLARVGAYYHDIGKTIKPQYFIENQLSIRNPHDFIEPKESADVIIRHPYDGAELLRKHKIPKEIIDITMQHHGTSLLKFFYYKEKESNPDAEESRFRYPGPKPQTKEAAIVCICDSVEAAVRALKDPTEEKIEEIVAAIIKDKTTDGQLDDSPITLRELNQIQRTICETLKGIFHSRIQYPTKEAN
ncbi:HDIG domain-containing protein [Oceanobacillus piezotolerans]|uniref:HDIG domain-containing protein n=2 Tax=Oceanobacillus piezotolerans TaxID=2448030 RepID=A0A498DUJ5_9BACI|nr:HDIG domain-containing metalloprotein [Oceanobacillus piezotolerans]RLL48527.1 HDIG domain-containing protein [Oceanobacillus piezotolerans]